MSSIKKKNTRNKKSLKLDFKPKSKLKSLNKKKNDERDEMEDERDEMEDERDERDEMEDERDEMEDERDERDEIEDERDESKERDDLEKKNCLNKMCEVNKFEKKVEDIHNSFLSIFQKLILELKSKLKKKITPEQEKQTKQLILYYENNIEKQVNKHIENKEKNINKLIKECEKLYCNKGCLGTIFEDGDANELPSKFIEEFKDNKKLIDILVKNRKEIFKNETSVLRNNFYKDLTDKDVKELQREGSISFCSKFKPNEIKLIESKIMNFIK
jgi:hypothetical protein